MKNHATRRRRDAQRLLEKAVRRGNTYQVTNLLDTMQPEPRDLDRAMCAAVKNGLVGIVMVLVERGAKLERPDFGDTSLLAVAADNGHVEVVKLLLDHSAEHGDAVDRVNVGRHYEVVSLLLERGVEVNRSDERSNVLPLYVAAIYGDKDMVSLLLSYGASPDTLTRTYSDMTDRENALHGAVMCGHFDVASVLLNHNAGAHVRTKHGRTAFHKVLEGGHEQMLDLLLQHGADPRCIVQPEEEEEEYEEVRQQKYIEYYNEDGLHGLHIVAWFRASHLVDVLWNVYVDMEAMTKCGKMALHLAARVDSPSTVTEILDHGVSVLAIDAEGISALQWATYGSSSRTAQVLIKHGADINTADKNGGTVLHWAMRKSDVSFVVQLLDWGANVHAVDVHGRSVLDHLVRNWSCVLPEDKIVLSRMFCKRGAKLSATNVADQADLEFHNAGLRVCTKLWQACYEYVVKPPDTSGHSVGFGREHVESYITAHVQDGRLLNAVLTARCKEDPH